MSAYDALSVCYDRLMDFDYPALCDRYESVFAQYRLKPRRILDLGCGTGAVTAELASRGYSVIGLDASRQMLTEAALRTAECKNVLLLAGDMRSIDPSLSVDCAVCALDGINHLARCEYIEQTFSGVYNALGEKGVFIFDLHSRKKFYDILGDNCFTYDYDDLFCSWDCRLSDSRIDYSINVFVQGKNGRYDRYTDDFSEYYRSEKTITRIAQKLGFTVLKVDDGDPQRVFFVIGKGVANE